MGPSSRDLPNRPSACPVLVFLRKKRTFGQREKKLRDVEGLRCGVLVRCYHSGHYEQDVTTFGDKITGFRFLDIMSNIIEVIVNKYVTGQEIVINIKKESTLIDVKKALEIEEGIKPARQSIFCGPFELKDDEVPLSDLLELNDNNLDVLFPVAADPEVNVQSDVDVTVVTGKKHRFSRKRIAAKTPTKVTVEKGNLGIVTKPPNVNAEGRDVYTADVYKFREEEEDIEVVLRERAGEVVVFKMIDGKEVELTEKRTKEFVFVPTGERAWQTVKDIGKLLGNIGRFCRPVVNSVDMLAEDGEI